MVMRDLQQSKGLGCVIRTANCERPTCVSHTTYNVSSRGACACNSLMQALMKHPFMMRGKGFFSDILVQPVPMPVVYQGIVGTNYSGCWSLIRIESYWSLKASTYCTRDDGIGINL